MGPEVTASLTRRRSRLANSPLVAGGVLFAVLLVAAAVFAAAPVTARSLMGPDGATPIANSDGEIRELQKLTSATRATNDRFGYSVSISGDTAFVGAIGTEFARGSVYVYSRDSQGRWSSSTRLTASDGGANDAFGGAVVVAGDTAMVGATNDLGGIGCVYVFTRDALGNWSEKAKLQAPDGTANAYFGSAISLVGDTAVIGAYGDSSNQGTAYVFIRDAAGDWSKRARLDASDAAAGARFGCSVALVGDEVLIGASDDTGSRGAVYVFARDVDGNWDERTKLATSNAADSYFGYSVSSSGDTALLGARGAAYVFTRDADGTWGETTRLTASDGATSVYFGYSGVVSGDTAVIGAWGSATNRGAVFVFGRDRDGNWSERRKLTAADGATYDGLGKSLAFSDGTALAGASGDDLNRGSAYLFDTGYRTSEDSPLVVEAVRGVLANDTDADSPHSALTPELVDTSSLHGTLDLRADGGFTYTPDRDWNGVATATYRVSDGTGSSNTAVLTIQVDSAKDAPVAVADAASGDEDAKITFNVLANDASPDTDSTVLTATDFSAPSIGGAIAADSSGEVAFMPPANWSGQTSFTYRAFDGERASSPAVVTITVRPINDAPIAVADVAGCAENGSTIIDVLGNDTDIDSPRASLAAKDISAVSVGSLVASATGELVYTPPLDFIGTATFTYRAYDGGLLSDPTTVTVTVQRSVVTRIDGGDRFIVADRTARNGWDTKLDKSWPGVRHVIIANGDDGKQADPLCAAGLAGVYDAPVLLVKSSGVQPSTIAILTEIAAANPGVRLHIVGGTASVSDARWNELKRIPGVSQVKDRIGGADRYAVSAGIASRMVSLKGTAAIKGVLLVAGDNSNAFYDALAASPITFAGTMPMLTVRKNQIPPVVAQLLKGKLAGKPRFAVSSTKYIGAVPGARATRLATSSDRYKAAAQIAQQALNRGWLTPSEAGISAKLSDALTGGTFLGKRDGVMLYSDGDASMPQATKDFINAHDDRILIGWVLGGHSSLTEDQESAFWRLLE